MKHSDPIIWSRCLSEKNLEFISSKLTAVDFSRMYSFIDCNDKWSFLKKSFITIIDGIAPLKKKTIKIDDKCPWFDAELVKVKSNRDYLYASAKESKNEIEWKKYKVAKN